MTDFPVARPLAAYVSHVTAYEETIPAGRELHERVLPDGAVRLMFNLGDAPSGGADGGLPLEVAGASAEAVVLRLRGRIAGVSVTLRPGAAGALLGVPASAIAGQLVGLEALWPGADQIREALLAAPTDAARIAVVQAALCARLHDDDASSRRRAVRAVRLIANAGGRTRVADLAAAMGIGERRLQQLFRLHVGLSPRAYGRLARLHACLRALRSDPTPQWSHIALDGGFYDQSHLVNEFRALSGLTPGAFFERTAVGGSSAVAGSSKT